MITSNIQAEQSFESGSHLETLYQTVPHWREILAAVKAGHAEFVDLLADTGLLDRFGLATSTVHHYDEVEVHAFILAIVSAGRTDEIQAKSFLTYASHWIDDFFDSPDKVRDPGQLLIDRGDIRRALANMGPVGQVGFAMANRVRHPAAVYKSLHRMLYGGLVQRCLDYETRRILVDEYYTVATRFVDARLAARIRRLQPQVYWTTNKTVQELLYAAETEVDFDRAEVWNLIYGPALYYQDADQERASGELNFQDGEAPELPAMLDMIRLGARHLAPRSAGNRLNLLQLEFAALAIPNLPAEVVSAYREICAGRLPASPARITCEPDHEEAPQRTGSL
ncbi:MAG TPA: hypothetical protein VNF29_12455 [Candidatus Binataceae bacterium]|nr:hypothetical protein [Candidatus Binataceae bacterium]